MADTLLVTGANGFVALHVIKDAITQGYKVVGTVRSIAAAEKIMKVFPHSSSQAANHRSARHYKGEQFRNGLSEVQNRSCHQHSVTTSK